MHDLCSLRPSVTRLNPPHSTLSHSPNSSSPVLVLKICTVLKSGLKSHKSAQWERNPSHSCLNGRAPASAAAM